ncbi:MAG TPA: TIM barrel protein [Verrucomicrobiota bacterium]|nr:xylose isomerase [Verrucomicrobiales bacterium]HRI16305.1 TIM barrel protein [Verrucomicrobiota bacterium]
MILCGIGDEAGNTLTSQLEATRLLGWSHLEARNVEVPGFPKANLHDLPGPAFDQACEALSAAGVKVYCFGSTIMNWSKRVTDPFDVTLSEVTRTIPRMQRLGARFVRIMSFKPAEDEEQIPPEVLRRVREVVARFREAGIQAVHENCMNYGGMSPSHGRELLDAVPDLKWVFDTANPVFNPDRNKPKPWPRQDPWEFWLAVRDRVAHVHVKDARWNPAKNDADYTWPGQGDGAVKRILGDALARGYNGGISIEPHMVAVFHDISQAPAQDQALRTNFVEYGRRLEALLAEVRPVSGTRPSDPRQ